MDAIAPASASYRLVPVLDNVAIARDTYRLRLGDAAMARAIKPGQFVMIRPGCEGASDPLLGRPLALYDVVRDSRHAPTAFDVVYLVVGGARPPSRKRRPGERIAVWGPLGNGFGPPPSGPVVFVAGGIGQTPFLALGRSWLGKERYGERAGDAAPAIGHRSPNDHIALRRTDRGIPCGRRRLPSRWHRGRAGDRRRHRRSPWLRHRILARRLERVIAPPRSLDAGRRRCWPPLAKIAEQYKFPATSHWKTTWRAASVRASVAWPRFVRPTDRPTSPRVRRRTGRRGRSGRLAAAAFIDPRGDRDDVTAAFTAVLASGPGSDRGAWLPARSLPGRRPRRAVRARSFRPTNFLRISCS